MREKTRALTAIAAVLSFPLLAATADAQADRGRAPVIRLSTSLGSSVVSNYIEPSIMLSEDAYVFAISVDVDRSIRVLHPDFPGLSVKMTSRKELHLPNFFAGYGEPSGSTSGRYASSAYDGYDPGYTDARGTVIALASRKPFNLAAVTVGGDWDVAELRRLVNGRDPHAAASALARYIGAKGEPIGRDVLRFAGAPRYYTSDFYTGNFSDFYTSDFYECSPYGRLGYGHPFSQWGVDWFRAAQFRAAGYAVTFLGTDACGQPRYAVHGRGAVRPGGRPPATGAFPRKRPPTGLPRNPVKDDPTSGRMGARSPLDRRPTERVVTKPAPLGRTADPRPGTDRYYPRPAAGAFPDRVRVPERVSPPPRVNVPERRPAPVAAQPQAVSRPAPPRRVEARPAPRGVDRAGKPVDQ